MAIPDINWALLNPSNHLRDQLAEAAQIGVTRATGLPPTDWQRGVAYGFTLGIIESCCFGDPQAIFDLGMEILKAFERRRECQTPA